MTEAVPTPDHTAGALGSEDIAVGPHHLRVYRSGTSGMRPVLWLHGAGPGVGAHTNWAALMTRFAATYDNVAPDLLGFADSSHPDPAPIGVAAYADLRATTVLTLLDALGMDRVDVVGNSMGGMIALLLAQRAPDRFDRIVLHGTPGAPSAGPPRAERVVSFYDDPSRAAMHGLLANFFADPQAHETELSTMTDDRLGVAVRADVRRSHLATFDRSGAALTFTPEQLGSIGHRVLVVHGREDRLVPVSAAVELVERIPYAELHVLPQAGHWVHVEQRERFAHVLAAFFAEGRS